MKYTRYISTIFKCNGVPQLSNRGFGIVMNVIHLEGAIEALRKAQKKESNDALKFKYTIEIETYQSRIDSLTARKEPAAFILTVVKLA